MTTDEHLKMLAESIVQLVEKLDAIERRVQLLEDIGGYDDHGS